MSQVWSFVCSALFLALLASPIMVSERAQAADIIRTIGNRPVTCRPTSRGMVAGTSRQVKKGKKRITLFTSFSSQISKLNRDIRKAKGGKKRKLTTQLTNLKALAAAAKTTCDAASGTPGGGAPLPVELSLDRLTRSMTADDVLFLMEKAGYGFNPRKHQYLLELAASEGVNGVVDHLMTVRPEVPGLEARLFERLDDDVRPGTTERDNYTPNGMREAVIEYALHTNNPVLVRLADETFFGKWTVNHAALSTGRQYEIFFDYRKVLRRYAFEGGTMRDLLIEISKHPMMLWFLDNGSSTAGSPNENYAREIQELYSMGRERWADDCQSKIPNYVEEHQGLRQLGDIFQATLALTGWTVLDRTIDGERYFRAVFSEADHRTGEKIMYRGTPWQRSVYVMEDLVEAIMNHPGTAQGLATDLLKAYVTPEPGCREVLEFARIIRAQNFNLREAARTLFKSNLFYNPSFHKSVIKSPVHRTAQIVNALGLTYSTEDLSQNREIGVNIDHVRNMLEAQGMNINSPPTVFYYDQANWASQRSFSSFVNLVGDIIWDHGNIAQLTGAFVENDPTTDDDDEWVYLDWWRPPGELLARGLVVDLAGRLRVNIAGNLDQLAYYTNTWRDGTQSQYRVVRRMYDNQLADWYSYDKLRRLWVVLASHPSFFAS